MRAIESVVKSVTVSIVSHNQQHMIVPLLRQLAEHCGRTVAKIVVTVNVPEADLISNGAWDVPVEVLHNLHPRGFGANHNAAFARCNTDWFLVLNPDIRLADDALLQILGTATATTGLMAPRIREPDTTKTEPHRALLTPCEIFRRRKCGYSPPIKPAWVPGMFMLFRSTAYQQVDGFDSRFFMYGEDFDICARTRLAGWQMHIDEKTVVLHAAQRDSHRRPRHLYWHVISLCKVWLSSAFWRYRTMWNRA